MNYNIIPAFYPRFYAQLTYAASTTRKVLDIGRSCCDYVYFLSVLFTLFYKNSIAATMYPCVLPSIAEDHSK